LKNHIAFLLCGATGLLTFNGAGAAPSPSASAPVQSYADLLEPIPNALTALITDDLTKAHQPKPLLQLAQYHHHHHHHHHHSFYPYHHHHHHHHHGYFGGGIVVAPPAYGYGPDCYIQRRVVITPYGERIVRNVRVCD
jgi:hypothetical protein